MIGVGVFDDGAEFVAVVEFGIGNVIDVCVGVDENIEEQFIFVQFVDGNVGERVVVVFGEGSAHIIGGRGKDVKANRRSGE